jgi:hypothetical protein
MTVIKRVVVEKDVVCDKCKETITKGNEAVKDRREHKKKGTKYYHVNHVP